jgi:hypothetical protein
MAWGLRLRMALYALSPVSPWSAKEEEHAATVLRARPGVTTLASHYDRAAAFFSYVGRRVLFDLTN